MSSGRQQLCIKPTGFLVFFSVITSGRSFYSFIFPVDHIFKNDANSLSYIPLIILYVSIIFLLSLLYVIVGKFNFLSLSGYEGLLGRVVV